MTNWCMERRYIGIPPPQKRDLPQTGRRGLPHSPHRFEDASVSGRVVCAFPVAVVTQVVTSVAKEPGKEKLTVRCYTIGVEDPALDDRRKGDAQGEQ